MIEVSAKEIHDSRGNPTIEVMVTYNGNSAVASVPSGKSAGSREAFEMRDADGKGVQRAIENVNTLIAGVLREMPLDPMRVDERLIEFDGTENKTRLGANAMLGVSIAIHRLAAKVAGVPLWRLVADLTLSNPSIPRMYVNMLNGGAHAAFALPFQEYIVVVGSESAREGYAKVNRIFENLGALIKDRFGEVPMGDEGGYSPKLEGLEKPFSLLTDAVDNESGTFLAIDAAASEFFHDGKYLIDGISYTSSELAGIYQTLTSQFDLKSIEDPFDENDLSAFELMTGLAGHSLFVVGDDLTVTNPGIVREMVAHHRANAMIVKPNQIGTLTEVFETVQIAKNAGWKLIASHRSGETHDTFIADIAVGIGAYGLKAGAPSQPERWVKYERLIEIEKDLLQ